MKWHSLLIRKREVFQVPFKPFEHSMSPAFTLSICFTRRMAIQIVNLNDSSLSA